MEEGIPIKTDALIDGEEFVVDNRLQFKDGRLYISKTPYKEGDQSDFPELIDVTDEVMEALVKAYYKRVDAQRQAALVKSLTTQL